MTGRDNRKEEFEKAALPHMDSLYYAALHMTGAREKAEDLVQETYLKAYRAFARFERGNKLQGLVVPHNEEYIHQCLP